MSEPFSKTLTRATLWAAGLGAGFFFVFPRHGAAFVDFVDAFTIAFCFTFLGQYTDRLLLTLPGITTGIGPLVRAAGWFAGGLWSYVVGRWVWLRYGRDLSELPGVLWGGVFLIVLELVMTRFAARGDTSSE